MMSKEEDQESLQMILKCMVSIDGFVQTRKKNNKTKTKTKTEQQKNGTHRHREQTGSYQSGGGMRQVGVGGDGVQTYT